MNIWLDCLTALSNYGWPVFSILLMLTWGTLVTRKVLVKIFKDCLTEAEYLSLSMAGWILPVSLWAAIFFGTILLFGETVTRLFLAFVILVSLPAVFGRLGRISSSVPVLGLFFIVSIVLLFAFLQKTILPLYFDSAEHYRIIKYFLETAKFPVGNYYHIGYHFLSATLSRFFQLSIVDTMLVFGQVALAALPISLFFIVKRETGVNITAWFTCLLAGFGWHMPAHLVNWGKYPALFSLLFFHLVLSLGYLAYRNDQYKAQRSKIYLLIGFGIFLSAFIHTRSLVVYAGMGISALFVLWRKYLPVTAQRLVFVLVVCILAIEIIYVQKSRVLSPLLAGYIQNDSWITVLAMVLLFFSIKYYADLTFFLLALFFILILGLFIPIQLPGLGILTLMDRPYVQMLLYLPLSMFGGLGLAGLHQFLQGLSFHPKRLTQLATLSVFGSVVLNAYANHAFYPSDCCQIVSRDDLAALQWMDITLPPDANILVASANLYVTSFEPLDARTGVDGGIWITPLTSRKTTFASRQLSFDQPETHAWICSQKIGYIYIGARMQSFSDNQFVSHPEWYREVFALPSSKIYQALGCE
jgi:hypothetical protein